MGLADASAGFVRASLPRWRPTHRVDLALCDPPYGDVDVVALCDGLDARVLVVETDRTLAPPPGWEATSERRYGGTLITMLQRASDERTP